MKDNLNGADLIKINDKIEDLKYERRVLKCKKRMYIKNILKSILRIFTVIFADAIFPASLVAGWIFLLNLSPILGVGFPLIGIAEAVYYICVIYKLGNKIGDGENYFAHPHFDYLINNIKKKNAMGKEIKINKRRSNNLKSTEKMIAVTKEQEEYLVNKYKTLLVSKIDEECNLDVIDPNYPAMNYTRKDQLSDLYSLKAELSKWKKIEYDKKYQKEKEKIKKINYYYFGE